MITREQLADQFVAHLPPGRAFDTSRASTTWAVALALAGLPLDLRQRAADLLRESDPRTTGELLLDWERTYGLPGPCVTDELSTAMRRAALLQRVTDPGGQSIAYFVEIAAAVGWPVEIEEYEPFRMGVGAMGDPVRGVAWAFAWTVHAPPYSPVWFAAGASTANDPITQSLRGVLECAIRAAAPAHTVVSFVYDLTPAPGPWTELELGPLDVVLEAGLAGAQQA